MRLVFSGLKTGVGYILLLENKGYWFYCFLNSTSWSFLVSSASFSGCLIMWCPVSGCTYDAWAFHVCESIPPGWERWKQTPNVANSIVYSLVYTVLLPGILGAIQLLVCMQKWRVGEWPICGLRAVLVTYTSPGSPGESWNHSMYILLKQKCMCWLGHILRCMMAGRQRPLWRAGSGKMPHRQTPSAV